MKYENEYLKILTEELKKAMGCTEPIAISYLACTARDLLGILPKKVDVFVSGNILKNVKSVVVPNTEGMRGIKPAVAIGLVGGITELKLECLSKINENDIKNCKKFIDSTEINILPIDSKYQFDLKLIMYSTTNEVEARIVDNHTNIVYLRKNDEILINKDLSNVVTFTSLTSHSVLSVEEIFNFANEVELDKVKDLIETQIKCNMEIAEKGLAHNFGANIGSTILKENPNCTKTKAKAYTAAASDARMNGCDLPVVINNGSGNQGITCSIPVVIYADAYNIPYERKIRALVLSNLLTTHVKSGIGRLSAYCGVVVAGCAAGAAISYLIGGDLKSISHSLVNSLAILSGVICDGAKASCAAKIASSVDAGILGCELYLNGNQFYSGDGIVSKDVEKTIKNVGIVARQGMLETDKEIINLMFNN